MEELQDEEVVQFLRACDRVLNQENFDDYLRKESYLVAVNTIAGKSKHCNYCMYCDNHRSCLATRKKRITHKLCWKARNILLLKEAGLYGEKINTPTGVN